MENILKEISDFVDSKKEEMINLWQEIVNIESYTNDKESIYNVAHVLKSAFEEEGFQCELVPSEPNGCTLTGILGSDRKSKPVIFSGHMDTVFEIGTINKRPFTIKEGKAYGPGVLDMKGGIVIALYVVKALNQIGFNERPIKIIFSGDEEIGHYKSNGGNIIYNFAKDALCAFNMETGLIDNSLCIGRKGRIGCDIMVNGVESHAGNDFLSGKNAIEETCFKVIDIRKLTNLETGTTCSTTIIEGGRINNSIPKECKISLDIRFDKVSEMKKIKESLKEICDKSYIDGTTTDLIFTSEMMPFETTEDVLNLHSFVNDISLNNNFGEIGFKKLGGGSDASYLTIAKVPTLCSCGVKGQWNHTVDEYAIVDSMFERTKLLSTIILNLKKFNN